MKAVVQDRYGSMGVLELREVDKPAIGSGEVLVRVRAAAVNPPDLAAVSGVPYIVRTAFGLTRPRVRSRGTDVAGVVDAVGPGVTRLAAGDEVFGRGVGTFAEYAVAPEEALVPKPADLTFEQAGCVTMSGLTALQALRDIGKLQPGQRVLVVGAGGGIGTFAVQIAKSMGAEVTGVCAASKVDLVRSIGADHVIDYTEEDFTGRGERYDVVLDSVLDHSLSRLVRVVEPHGVLIPNGGQFYKRWIASMGVNLVKAPLLATIVSQSIQSFLMRPSQADLLVISELMGSGQVTPIIDRTYPLRQTAEAIAYFGQGHAGGKVVIAV